MLGDWLADVIRNNPDNFRIFGPDETASNRLQAVYDVTNKQWNAQYLDTDEGEHLARAAMTAVGFALIPIGGILILDRLLIAVGTRPLMLSIGVLGALCSIAWVRWRRMN